MAIPAAEAQSRGLSLLAGPAHAGKVALLLERYLARLDDEPFLIVPNRSDVDRVERDLLRRAGCLLGGEIGTFDDLFRRIVAGDPRMRPVASDAQRGLVARRAAAEVVRAGTTTLARSARFSGFADALLAAVAELESGLLDPADLDGDLGELYAAYRRELDRVGFWDRDLLRRRASERIQTELDAWHGEPVFAYGFEDLTAAEWALLEALAGRAEVDVSLPYEPGRTAFASLQRTAEDLAALADGRTRELPPGSSGFAAPALAWLERNLFEPPRTHAPPIAGAVGFLEGAGARGSLELVADELLDLLRDGVPAEDVALVVPTVERWRAPLETVFATAGIPYAIDGRVRKPSSPFGHAHLALLGFAWAGAGLNELYAFLRSPYSGIARSSVDFAEGRLRGRAVSQPDQVEAETERLREAPLVPLRTLRDADSPVEGVRVLLTEMAAAAYGLDGPPVGDTSRLDLRCVAAATRLLDELEAWEQLGEPLDTADVIGALERLEVSTGDASDPGRVAVLDLMRARTRRFDTVFVLGLEEGSLPRRGRGSPFLDDDRRRELGARLERPEPVSRDRYLFYTACTRATRRLYLVREAATDDGAPMQASSFWDDVAAVFDPADVARATRPRALSQLTLPIDEAPTARERLRALASLSADAGSTDLAVALADANGWTRRLRRARAAFDRPTRLHNTVAVEGLATRTTFGATELERFVDCSSAWLFERVVDPKTIDAEADALLRGKVAHQALYSFYNGLPKELGTERVTEANLDAALVFLEQCLADALRGGVRIELADVAAAELREGLRRDLERFVREEARSPLGLLPRRFEVRFGTDRSAPELQRGLEIDDGIFVSGTIDRIDVDPHSARGIVQDYKSGKGSFSATQILDEARLQVPLYLLVLRDLVGIEPLGGVYRALSGTRGARGMLRGDAREDLPGFQRRDYLDVDAFAAQLDTAVERARTAARRIRAGDVAHDPKGGECPSWCDVWRMCRVARA
jgi:ATP-dependent helicase/DNAse subunit B